jgi:hypothetical protein
MQSMKLILEATLILHTIVRSGVNIKLQKFKISGRVEKVVLSYGGFLDIGDHLAIVPYRTIGFTNRGITYDITRREIENLPKYRY